MYLFAVLAKLGEQTEDRKVIENAVLLFSVEEQLR